MYLKNIFDEGELEKNSVVKKFLTTAEQDYLEILNKHVEEINKDGKLLNEENKND